MRTRVAVTLTLLMASPPGVGQDFSDHDDLLNNALLPRFELWATPSFNEDSSFNASFTRGINCLVLQHRDGAVCADVLRPSSRRQDRTTVRQIWLAPGYAVDNAGGKLDESMVLRGTIDYYRGQPYQFRKRWISVQERTRRR